MSILSKKFYNRDTVLVARELLGKRIVRRIGKDKVSVIITETEAYSNDPASHAYRGMTQRNKVMFGEVGRAYVYFIYGMHYCFNVVAKSDSSKAGAVLIRSAMPEFGISIMQKNRNNHKDISDGPAKLSQALQITKKQYGVDLTSSSELRITSGIDAGKILTGPRVGISQARELQWNFKLVVI